jgi:Predicted metal-binding integral membrane protein
MATMADAVGARRRNPAAPWALATYAALLVLAGAAWLVSDLRMSGMDAGPGSPLGTFGFFITTWVVMMAAMMFPSAAPMVSMYVNIQRGRRRREMPVVAGASACFVGGYLLVWSFAGVLAYLVFAAVGRVGVTWLGWSRGGRWIAVAVLLAAALYEVTPLKRACLGRCRSPLSFLLSSWRSGRRGAVQMGARHGAWCLGCCWALMAALFALGVMSLAWMTVIGALIAIEKLLPWRRIGLATTITVLLVLAAGVAFAPEHVPGLTLPGSHSMMSS